MIILKNTEEIEKMKQASKIALKALLASKEMARVGARAAEIDKKAEKIILENGGVPAFKGYRGYQYSTCLSVNEEVVHGIPYPDKVLKEGDILGIDVGVKLDGFFGDVAETVAVGELNSQAARLLEKTREALFMAINLCKSGNRLGQVSAAIEELASKNGYTVVRDHFGHGIGRELHEDPLVPNFGRHNEGPVLRDGMTFAIEPMFNVGGYKVKTLKDGWTVVTMDGALSAHFEHTVAMVRGQAEILTKL